jgi:hypothetical protein
MQERQQVVTEAIMNTKLLTGDDHELMIPEAQGTALHRAMSE